MTQLNHDCAHDCADVSRRAACCTRSPYVASRRAVFGGVAAVASVPLLAACTSGDDNGEVAGGPEDQSAGPEGRGGGIATSDVPVGGGTIVEGEELVITQPTAGEFRAFSSICTHNGCPVTEVREDGIFCTCHRSLFSLEDGSPLEGPADEPLAERTVLVEGDTLTVS